MVEETLDNDNTEESGNPIELEEVLAEFDNDKEFLDEVIDGFITRANVQLETIRQGVVNKDRELIGREAHSLKGAAANLHAHPLYKAASGLDRICKTGDMSAINGALDHTISEFKKLEVYVKSA